MLTTVRSSVRVLIAVLLAVAARPSLSADPPANEAVGRVTHVTLYRGQAMVSRTIPLEGPPARQELVVKDLPEQVVAGSLFAEGGEAIEVRAVRFRTRAVGQEPREEVRKLDLAIEAVNEKLAAEHKTQEVLAATRRLPRPDGGLRGPHRENRPRPRLPRRRRLAENHLVLLRAA